jgi:hypothetical protein
VLPQKDCPATHHRYPTRVALGHLTELLHLKPDAYMQDWEVELADAARVDEFLDAYEKVQLDDDDRFLLMAMIIASVDDAKSSGLELGSSWPRAEHFLRRDGALHATTLSYWACGSDPDPDHQFAVTPLIRPIWRDVLQTLSNSA